MSIRIPSDERAARIRSFFARTGYSEDFLVSCLGRRNPIMLAAADQQTEATLLPADAALSVLTMLFFLEMPVSGARFRSSLPGAIRDDLLHTGLVAKRNSQVLATALLVPVSDLLIAGDRFVKHGEDAGAEHVLSVNPPARFLANLTVDWPVGRLLDLCTGNGIQALLSAPCAETVTATDLNPRAIRLAALNAALNGVANIRFLEGRSFEPVEGQTFDRIVCNPPYILTPEQRFMCTDNSEELDGFCRELLREAPGFLADGGLIQMICEWVETGSQDWRERLAGWFRGLGCDAWVICSGQSPVEAYAARRSQQSLVPSADPQEQTREWIRYFRRRGVVLIRSGLIQLRRRRGRNWQSFTSLGSAAAQGAGAEVAAGWVSRDLYMQAGQDKLLAMAPMPADDVAVEPDAARGSTALRFQRRGALPVSFMASPAVAALFSRLDGCVTLVQLSDELAREAGLDIQAARRECCEVARELLSQGLIQVAVPPTRDHR